jgi:hypothetical protein
MRYAVNAPRTNELAVWMKINDIDVDEVPYSSPVFVEVDEAGDWSIRYDVYVRSVSGVILYDRVRQEFEIAERSMPLVNDPPMWWLKEMETAPTGGGAVSGCATHPDATGCEETVAEGACHCD